jgi:phenylalanine-4-hydroxylase
VLLFLLTPLKDHSDNPVPKGPVFFLPSALTNTNKMEQIYDNYTQEDRLVWKTLFDRQMQNLEQLASRSYLEALETINFCGDKIPNFSEVDEILGRSNGWKMKVVPTIIPQKAFFELLAARRFPATTWLRKMNQLDYLEEPDMFHDVFGHVPLLSNEAYTHFFLGMAALALKHSENPRAIDLLGRLYWFTIEFGLIREKGNLKIYGAGILSSSGETAYSLSDKPRHVDFDVQQVMKSTFRTDVFQEQYFVIESFQSLYRSLPEIEVELKKQLQETN